MSISPAQIEATLTETSSSSEDRRRFGDLRGVQWRIDLGILPSSSSSSSVDDLRRVTANCRRRYASLRRQLLVDPQILKEGNCCPDLVMDNPLSQNPDSMWGRFFRYAELERMVDQDLTRLYPERGSFFQTPRCQSILRRILIFWCLCHPEYGYRQGMHELLAPLLYVLLVDLELLSEVRKAYEDHFTDVFDNLSFHGNDWTHKWDFKKSPDYVEDSNESESQAKINTHGELEPKIQTILSLSDAYGAEGELGVILSEKFLEHDAYSMFDTLMNGNGGAVAMAEFFSPSPFGGSHTVFPPIIEASATLYHLLSLVDSSLHSHLVELGVEPQYFSLRWLRVLFGREFALEDLLVIWDEIFASENTKLNKPDANEAESRVAVLNSPRGALISAFAVSLILHIRSSLLATENATSCLQRLLNFPDDVNLVKLLDKAKSLQALAVEAINSTPLMNLPSLHGRHKSGVTKGHSLSLDSISPKTSLNMEHESYWEEKWRVLHTEEEERKQGFGEKPVTNTIKGWSERVRLRLSSRKKIHEHDVKDNNVNSPERRCSTVYPGKDVNMSASSSVASNFSIGESVANSFNFEPSGANSESSPLPVSDLGPIGANSNLTPKGSFVGKHDGSVKERKLLSGKFHWLWKFSRYANEGTSDSNTVSEDAKACDNGNHDDECNNSSEISNGEIVDQIVDQNPTVSLSDLGRSMLKNIQVIVSVFQQDPGQVEPSENSSNAFVGGEGEVKAMTSLEELRKIGNLLSEM